MGGSGNFLKTFKLIELVKISQNALLATDVIFNQIWACM